MTRQVTEILMLDGRFTDFVNRLTKKDGTLVDVLWSASWSESDKIMFCVAHDVTDRTRMEKALREAKEEADRANRNAGQPYVDELSRFAHRTGPRPAHCRGAAVDCGGGQPGQLARNTQQADGT